MPTINETVLEFARQHKTINYISEQCKLTRTQVGNILIEFLAKSEPKKSANTPIPEFSSLAIIEEKKTGKNNREINVKYKGKEKTLEDLINELDIDKSVWEITNVVYNEWDGMRPHDNGTIKLHQIKISLRRIILQTNYEIPKPVNITLNVVECNVRKSKSSSIKTAVILPDMQLGFRRDPSNGKLISLHDRKAMDVALQIARYIRPDRIVLLGDNLDLAQESKYPTGPEFYFTTQAAAVELAWWLAQLRAIDSEMQIDYLEGNHECFSEDTEILTEYGWAKYFEVLDDTKVATFNKITKEIEFQSFSERQVYEHTGNMYSIKNTSTDLLITPKHRVYWADGDRNHDFNMHAISEVTLNHSRKTQYCSGINKKQDYDISDDMIRLIAWIITDGSTRKVGNYKSIMLYQREGKVQLICDILDRLKINYKMKKRDRDITTICGVKLKKRPAIACEISINSKESIEIYKYINDKYDLPDWLYLLSNRQVDIFVNSLVDGDGSRKKEGKACSMLYGTKHVIDQVQMLLTLNGYRTSIYTYRNNQYKLNICKTNITTFDIISNYVKTENYSGIVWDFTVPNDTLVVRRNGKVSITGNCRLDKLLMQNAVSAYGLKAADNLEGPPLLSIQNLVGLNGLNIKYHPNYPQGKVALNDNLICIHGDVAKGESGATVSAVVKDTRVSVIQGHIHRYEVATKTLWGANDKAYMYTAASFGCLCKIEPSVVPGAKAYQNWQQGLGIVYYEEGGIQQFRQEFVPIIEGRAILQSEIFHASEEIDIIKAIEYDTSFKVH